MARKVVTATSWLDGKTEGVDYVGLRPQEGPQLAFAGCPADIAIYGGAAGSGKSFGLMMEPTYFLSTVPGFGGVLFRRTYPELTMEGALWDESYKVFGVMGGSAHKGSLSWTIPPYGNRISFRNIEYEKDVEKYHGSQIAFIGFDEVTTFTEKQFWYLLSRNRSSCGVQPYIRATCNPDPDSWVKEFISWWLDENQEYPDPAKSGVIRWFVRRNDEMMWADSKQELLDRFGPDSFPKSVTFIPAKLSDNVILETVNPDYRGNLMAMNLVEQQRLLHGNWKIRLEAGMLFKRQWFEVVDVVPSGLRRVRCWDKAATEPSTAYPDPDWTAGLLYAYGGEYFYVLDVVRMRGRPGDVEKVIQHTASIDGFQTEIGMEQEPGSSGVDTIEHYARDVLPGYNFTGTKPTGDKIVRAGVASAAAQNGLIKLLRGSWNTSFLSELEAFPTKGVHDDQIDVLSQAHEKLSQNTGKQPASPYAPKQTHGRFPDSSVLYPKLYQHGYQPESGMVIPRQR